MKKILIGIFTTIIILTGCGAEPTDPYQEIQETYVEDFVSNDNEVFPSRYKHTAASLLAEGFRHFEGIGLDIEEEIAAGNFSYDIQYKKVEELRLDCLVVQVKIKGISRDFSLLMQNNYD